MSQVTVSSLQIEHLRENLGIGINRPRLSWQIETELTNWRQIVYEMACFDAGGRECGQTGRVESDQSVMTSFNHYALGAVADWMHRTVGGLAPVEPGYRRLNFALRPGGGLTHCQTQFRTPYGLAECEWKITDGTIDMNVTVPPNARALVTVPGSDLDPIEVGSGRWHWSADYKDPDERGPYTVDDLVGEIIFDSTSRDTVLNVLKQAGAPGFVTAILLNERSMPLRQALHRLPNYEAAVQMMNEALAKFYSLARTG